MLRLSVWMDVLEIQMEGKRKKYAPINTHEYLVSRLRGNLLAS